MAFVKGRTRVVGEAQRYLSLFGGKESRLLDVSTMFCDFPGSCMKHPCTATNVLLLFRPIIIFNIFALWIHIFLVHYKCERALILLSVIVFFSPLEPALSSSCCSPVDKVAEYPRVPKYEYIEGT